MTATRGGGSRPILDGGISADLREDIKLSRLSIRVPLEQPFSTCGSQPLWDPLTKLSCMSDSYITVYISSKITVMKSHRNDFMVGDHHDMRNSVKELQH